MLTGWPFLLCIGSIVPSATNSKWHTLCYKVGLANNGPLDDMILVWSKCDFFFSIGSHDGDDRGATASLKVCWGFIGFHSKSENDEGQIKFFERSLEIGSSHYLNKTKVSKYIRKSQLNKIYVGTFSNSSDDFSQCLNYDNITIFVDDSNPWLEDSRGLARSGDF